MYEVLVKPLLENSLRYCVRSIGVTIVGRYVTLLCTKCWCNHCWKNVIRYCVRIIGVTIAGKFVTLLCTKYWCNHCWKIRYVTLYEVLL